MRRLPLFLVILAAPLLAEDDDPAKPKASLEPSGTDGFVRLRDSKRRYSIVIPATWKVEQAEFTDTFTRFELRYPGSDNRCRLFLELPSRPTGPRGYPASNRKLFASNAAMSRIRIGSDTIPHLIYQKDEGDNVLTVVHAFCLHHGRTVIATIVVPPQDFERVYQPFLHAALTSEINLPPWPSIPEGYKVTTKRGLRFAVHPAVKASTRHTLTTMRAVRKRFEKFHGKLPPTPKGSPAPVVFLHRDNQDAAAVASWLENKPAQFTRGWSTLCCFVVPVAKGDAEGTKALIRHYAGFLLHRRYGTGVPDWVRGGEATVARIETINGKALPRISIGTQGWADGLSLQTLDQLQLGTWEADTRTRQFFFYVAYFRCGGSRYSKAYRAFLDDLATRYDPEAAAKRHLEPLDYAKLKDAATKFMHRGFKILK